MLQPVPVQKSRPRGEAYGFWSWFCLLPLGLPLVAFDVLPCTDLPQHLAMSAIIGRLIQHDGATRALFELNLQPVPYYMLYVVLVPLVALLGALLAAKVLMAGMAAAWVAGMRRCLEAVGAPAALLLAVPIVFFGPMFFWGFAATLIGVPGVLFCLAGLLRCQAEPIGWRAALPPAAAALWATLSHVTLALPCILLAMWCLLQGPARRQMWRAPLAVLAAATLPLLPALWKMASQHGAVHVLWQPSSIDVQWTYVKQHLGPFDHGLGRAAHEAFWLVALGVCLVAQLRARRQLPPQLAYLPETPLRHRRRLIGATMWTLLLAYALTPRQIEVGDSMGFMLAYRYLCLVELLAIVLVVPPLCQRPSDLTLRRQLTVALLACCAVYSVAQWQIFAQFNGAAAPRLQMLRDLPAGQRLRVDKTAENFGRVAAPLLLHLSAYYTAEGGVAQSDLFAGGHLPIRWRGASQGLPLPRADFTLRIEARPQGGDRQPSAGGWHLRPVAAL